MSQELLESIVEQARQLSPLNRVRLVEQVMEILEEDVRERRRSLLGIWEGVDVSEEDIAEVRREMWQNFPL